MPIAFVTYETPFAPCGGIAAVMRYLPGWRKRLMRDNSCGRGVTVEDLVAARLSPDAGRERSACFVPRARFRRADASPAVAAVAGFSSKMCPRWPMWNGERPMLTHECSYCAQIPKAEIHVHLEGSVRPETLQKLDPDLTMSGIASLYAGAGLPPSGAVLSAIGQRLHSAADYARVTKELLSSLKQQNVIYVELSLPGTLILEQGLDLEAVCDAVHHEIARSRTDALVLIEAYRDAGPEQLLRLAKATASLRRYAVAGLLVGSRGQPAAVDKCQGAIEIAKTNGVKAVLELATDDSAEAVWAAIEAGADRIFGGLGAADDPVLLDYLKAEEVGLVVSPHAARLGQSQRRTDSVRRLLQARVPVVFANPYPAFSGATLSASYQEAQDQLLLDDAGVADAAVNAFYQAFKRPNAVEMMAIESSIRSARAPDAAVSPETPLRLRQRPAFYGFR